MELVEFTTELAQQVYARSLPSKVWMEFVLKLLDNVHDLSLLVMVLMEFVKISVEIVGGKWPLTFGVLVPVFISNYLILITEVNEHIVVTNRESTRIQ